ncbi:MAG TPA: DUF5985 family protein [Thermoanaerobaculia bacterium]|nr:DUF5985 family protein [Thermoanaerobaculia bacterium]
MASVFLSGLLTAMYAIAALYFLRFWRESADRLFAFFAGAFALLAVQRMLLLAYPDMVWLYLIRLIAFLLIIAAIADKNRAAA